VASDTVGHVLMKHPREWPALVRATLPVVQTFVQTFWRRAFSRTPPTPGATTQRTSPVGVGVQLVGMWLLLQGLYLVYHPLAYLVAGACFLLIGEKV
jgi:hypothetical protein